MKKAFVETKNVELFRAALKAVEQRGAPEASWLLVAGDPALGKSTTVKKWAAANRAIYLRAKKMWTPSFFIRDLAGELGEDEDGSLKSVFGRVIARIGHTQATIVIDEVQHCLHSGAAVLEELRDITDTTETMAVLVTGVEQVQSRIGKHAQISSRIARVVDFRPSTVEDIGLMCAQLCEVNVAPDAVALVHQQAQGRMRQTMNALVAIEAIARRNKLTTVTAADLQGVVLVQDWRVKRVAKEAA